MFFFFFSVIYIYYSSLSMFILIIQREAYPAKRTDTFLHLFLTCYVHGSFLIKRLINYFLISYVVLFNECLQTRFAIELRLSCETSHNFFVVIQQLGFE